MMRRVSAGFSFRIQAERQGEDPRQVDQYLMPTNRNPISADTSVWLMPGVLDNLLLDSTQEFWNPLGLAKSIQLLLDACRERGIQHEDLSPVCLTINGASMGSLIKRCGPGYFYNAPSEDDLLSTGWRFLGFDAVELNGLTSGLKGIGYKEPSLSELRKRFGGALNEVGLFSDEATAAEFAKVRGLEIPAHAPFDVVGVLIHDPISQ